jgi:DNA-binding transcriptional ArsR family regulator
MVQQGAFYMDEYKALQQFASVTAMNDHIKLVREGLAGDLSRTAADVLDYISRHACKVVGVAYIKAATIAEAIGKSYRTATTATKLLSDLGVIEKQEIMRKKTGGNGANVYIIKADCLANCLPLTAYREEAEKPCSTKDEQLNSEGTNSYSFKALEKDIKTLNKKSEKASLPIVQIELFSNIPEHIKNSLALLSDNKLGNDIWKKVIQAYVQSDLYNELNNIHLQKAINDNDLFYSTLTTKIYNVAYKQAHGQITVDVFALVYSTCKGFFNDEAAAIIEENAADTEITFEGFYKIVNNRQERPTFDYGTKDDLNELGIY